jgi:hypothetical protein
MTEAATFSATITDIRLESRTGTAARWQIALDRTLFSAASPTGVLTATAPSGAQLEVPVLGVVDEAGTVWHIVAKPLAEGTQITGQLG